MIVIFIVYTFTNSVFFNYEMLLFALMLLLLGVIQIKVKNAFYIIIFKNLLSISMILFYIVMFITLAVPNFEFKHIIFNILLVLSLFTVSLFGMIEIKLHKTDRKIDFTTTN